MRSVKEYLETQLFATLPLSEYVQESLYADCDVDAILDAVCSKREPKTVGEALKVRNVIMTLLIDGFRPCEIAQNGEAIWGYVDRYSG